MQVNFIIIDGFLNLVYGNFVGFQWMSLALLWFYALFECYFSFLNTQRNELPINIGNIINNYVSTLATRELQYWFRHVWNWGTLKI
jgi:hypothetical protein